MRGSIAFGRESLRGPLTTSPRTFEIMADTQEKCVICERVDERARMHHVGIEYLYGDDVGSLYVCSSPHPPPE